MSETYTANHGHARVSVDLPLRVLRHDGIRIVTDCGKEVAMWSEDELEQVQVDKVAQNAVRMAHNEPKKLLDKMSHHVVGTSEVAT